MIEGSISRWDLWCGR